MNDKDEKFSIGPISGGFVIDAKTQKVVHDANALNETLRQLRQGITVKVVALSPFDYSAPPPEGASWSFAPSTASIVDGTITDLDDITNAELAKEQDATRT